MNGTGHKHIEDPSNICDETYFCKISNAKLKPLTILVRRSILDASLAPECVSAGENINKVFKIQTEMSPWKQVKMALF